MEQRIRVTMTDGVADVRLIGSANQKEAVMANLHKRMAEIAEVEAGA